MTLFENFSSVQLDETTSRVEEPFYRQIYFVVTLRLRAVVTEQIWVGIGLAVRSELEQEVYLDSV